MTLLFFFNIEGGHRHGSGYFYHNLNVIRRLWTGSSITKKIQTVYWVQLVDDRKWWSKTKPIYSKSHHNKCWQTNSLKKRHSNCVFL